MESVELYRQEQALEKQLFRISVDFKEKSSEAVVLEKKLKQLGFSADIWASDVYTVRGSLSAKEIGMLAGALHNETVQSARINSPFAGKFDFALELGFLPGVTDNVAHTAREIASDLLKVDIDIFSSKVLFLSGVSRDDVNRIAISLVNTLIQRFHVKSFEEYARDGGMDFFVPDVRLQQEQEVIWVDLNVNDSELADIGRLGIIDPSTKRRGPLALDLESMRVIKKYFSKLGRCPSDIELESLAQTWSEHCKHTYFAAAIDEIGDGLFSHYIKRATNEIRQENDFCASVFKDNSGAIIFDENFLVTHKVETHNTPSALDPFGGSLTGIVGVNRDTIGFGLGAKPVANVYGFCVGLPEDSKIIYRTKDQPALSPKRILEGVISGVNAGGNCSGIPTPQGFVYFDDSYRGKPLVFAGTVGLIPKHIGSAASHEKSAMPGDNIVMIGGRVGKDGIHGATFSSEAMNEGSPVSAVQIGDPITQKKLSDAVVKEARGLRLYNSITDDGAGGLSCSVAEMARECGGFVVDLEKVPVKYPGLQPWEIWISESQERMTLAVPDSTLGEFVRLMESRGIEASVIGKFNNTKKAVVRFNRLEIFNMDMDFLHNGLPKRRLLTKPFAYKSGSEQVRVTDHEFIFMRMLGAHNICSLEFISRQYDHEVQGGSLLKPLQGRGRVNGNATVVRPLLDSVKGVVLSQSLYPRLSELSAYDMAACAIDTAVRNCVAAGGDVDRIALLDNFCWCSSDEPERLAQLKDAAKACYDYATAYRTPFISGKDSMFNDFKGLDSDGAQIKISVLPTLLISAIGVVGDVSRTCSIDLKMPGDLIYVIGMTKDECGGSEFYNLFGEIGSSQPRVDVSRALYKKMHELHEKALLSAAVSISHGGLAMALAKMSMAGLIGVECDLSKVHNQNLDVSRIMYSETQGRFIVSVAQKDREIFEREMQGFVLAEIGKAVGEDFILRNGQDTVLSVPLKKMEKKYKERFAEW